MWKIAAIVCGGAISILLIAVLVMYKNWTYEQELDSLLWKIDFKDIQINDSTPTTQTSKNVTLRTSQMSLSSTGESDFRHTTIYTTIGLYRGRMLAVKRIRKKSVDLTRNLKKELKFFRDLRHDNLNPFIGACIEPPNICIISEYCTRGSLKDILENEDVKLDNMFNASMIGDIVRGMTYLHDSQLRSHGNLKSSNCLVDSRWVVRISDFGLHNLQVDSDFGVMDLDVDTDLEWEKQCQRLLWSAPELLRDPSVSPCGTQKGDVYAFGIILYEIAGRRGPYGDTNLTASEIIRRVIKQEYGLLFRPNVSKLEGCFDCVVSCMQECWAEVPECRPDFRTIRMRLRPMRGGMKSNIFDNMLAMMEKYANNLEALVDERTDQLNEEKKKTDALLYEMLPRYVAEELKKGRKVEAESFDCVTIYFSDIVGFTTMAAQSSPLQVVEFLNDLYTTFDSTLENYDVYKVETIGDAYMVVSGLPVPNGDQHAAQVASMALQLLDVVARFPMRNQPKDTLRLRIGIHSGAVCAGVVGLKMPRYCLFGDTVNTASRMESTGIPLRIHCSKSFKLILDKLGGYFLEERGFVTIKGKGEMQTYWLIGQDVARQPKKTDVRCSSMKKRHFRTDKKSSLESSPKKLRFARKAYSDSIAVMQSQYVEEKNTRFSPDTQDQVMEL